MPGVPSEWCRLLILHAPNFQRCKRAAYPGELGLCGTIPGLPLSSNSTGCMPEAGAHGLELKTHHSHPRTGGQSMKAYSSIIHRNILGLCPLHNVMHVFEVHPLCTQECRSHLYVGQLANARWIPELHHRSHQSASCKFHEKGSASRSLSPSILLQVMHDRSTQFLLLCPLVGFPRGYPSPIGPMMTSYHFLPRPHPLWVSHPISDVLTQTSFVHALYIRARVLRPSFLLQLSKSEQLKFTEHPHTEHITHHTSCIPGKCV